MEKQLFRQLDKITQMGMLILFVFMMVMGLGIYEGMTGEKEALQDQAFCGFDSETSGRSLSTNQQIGKALFLENCASCHNHDMVSDMVGPALLGTKARWEKYDDAIYAWVQNSEALAESGNPRAKSMIKWSASTMPSFENLDKEQIDNILAYIESK